jgi:polysaccharide biosynthesis/export protein
MANVKISLTVLTALLLAGGLKAQSDAPVAAPSPASSSAKPATAAKPDCGSPGRSTYLLGPDDQIEVSAPELVELANKPTRIDGEGNVQVPLVGRVHVAGMTVEQTELELNKRLSTYIKQPQASVSIVEVRSQPVSVLGAVNTPGVHQVQGHKTLLEMLASAGGVRQDAGYSIRITRRLEWGCLPLPDARMDESGKFSVASVSLKEITDAKNPDDNIQIFPHDVISVPKAEMIFVIGDVKRSGGFALGEKQTMSVLQALSLAEGLNRTANGHHARILRLKQEADKREELSVDVSSVLAGKKPDVPLLADDILFIPGSVAKSTAMRTLEAFIQAGTGMAVWRMP